MSFNTDYTSMTTLKRLLPSITAFHEEENSITSFESWLVCNALVEPAEMLRLVALQTVKTEANGIFMKSLLKITNHPKTFLETQFDFNPENVIDFILSLEYYLRLCMREIWDMKSCRIFVDLIDNLKKSIMRQQKAGDVITKIQEVQLMKHKVEGSHKSYLSLKYYLKLLESSSEKTLFSDWLHIIWTHKIFESNVRNAEDKSWHKEKQHENELHHFQLLMKQEKDFKAYMEACVKRVSYLENELDYWSAKYDDEMEAIEHRRHLTQTAITNMNEGIKFYKDAIRVSHETHEKETANRINKHLEKEALAAQKKAEEEQALTKTKSKIKKQKTKTKRKLK